MSRAYEYAVYILASPSRTLYIGVTNDLARRLHEHRTGATPGFTSKHGVTRLIFVETYGYVSEAIAREKQLKGWRRDRKIALIEAENSRWVDRMKWKVASRPIHIPPLRVGGSFDFAQDDI